MAATDRPTLARSPEIVAIAQDEVVTGEAVALDVQPAGLFLRVLGAAIDLAIAIAILILVLWFASGPLSSLVSTAMLPTVALVTAVLVMVVMPTVIETATRGRSVGKLAIGARIVRHDGGAIGFRQALIRALLGVLEIYLTAGAVALLTGVFTSRAQRLGDLVAGTYSQRTRTVPLPPPLPGVPPPLEGWATLADVARLPDRLARRIAQFLRQSAAMRPEARARIAAELMAEAAPYVSPPPPSDPTTALAGIAAIRRDREYRALLTEQERTAALAPGLERAPHGFPRP